jgi:hypothetical protein
MTTSATGCCPYRAVCRESSSSTASWLALSYSDSSTSTSTSTSTYTYALTKTFTYLPYEKEKAVQDIAKKDCPKWWRAGLHPRRRLSSCRCVHTGLPILTSFLPALGTLTGSEGANPQKEGTAMSRSLLGLIGLNADAKIGRS